MNKIFMVKNSKPKLFALFVKVQGKLLLKYVTVAEDPDLSAKWRQLRSQFLRVFLMETSSPSETWGMSLSMEPLQIFRLLLLKFPLKSGQEKGTIWST